MRDVKGYAADNLVIYQEDNGTVPLRDWLDTLEAEPRTR